MDIKVIKNQEDYKKSIELLEKLMGIDPDPESEDGEKLSLLAKLIEDYELEIFPVSLPDPIEAIEFRMEQKNLKQADLVPYIGSSSKVSEVLSRKRPLTISMIRALEAGLGIPAKVLLKENDDFRDVESINWSKFPLKEIQKRGYVNSAKEDIKTIMENFFTSIGSIQSLCLMLRKTSYRSFRPVDKHALASWSAIVIKKANLIKDIVKFKDSSFDLNFMQNLAKLSIEDNWHELLKNELKKIGIILIIEPAFPQTYLDGATMMQEGKNPIIGLTLRHDRLDNFWFTLMHELAHVALHSKEGYSFFYDDLDSDNSGSNKEEIEADNLAGEALVPQNKWEVSPAKIIPSPMAATSLAKELGIHTAIVAGKIRHEGGHYTYLNKIINQAKVRQYFPNEKW